MKAELHPKPHSQIPGAIVIEVWHGGELIGTVTGADGPGIRISMAEVIAMLPLLGILLHPFPDAHHVAARRVDEDR